MGEPKLDDELDEASISAEWETIADGDLDLTTPGIQAGGGGASENDRPEPGGELFAELTRKPRARPVGLPSNSGARAEGMAVALSIVQGGKATRSPIPPPPSRKDLAALEAPRPRTPSQPAPSVRSVAPPPPSARAVTPPPAPSAPPPPSARAVAPPAPPAPPAPETKEPARVALPPIETVEVEAPAAEEPAPPPPVAVVASSPTVPAAVTQLPTKAPGLPRQGSAPPPPVDASPPPVVIAADAEKRPSDAPPKKNDDQTWSDETPTTLWRGGKHGIPPHIAERKRAERAKADSAPSIPPPPALPGELPPAPVSRARVATSPSMRPVAASSIPPMALSQPPPSPPRGRDLRTVVLAVAAALVVGVLALMVLVLPRSSVLAGTSEGALIVTVAATDNTAVGSLALFVDGTRRCEASPCRIENLSEGSHFVKVTAPGFAPTADRAIAVESGQDSVLHIELTRLGEPASAGADKAQQREPAEPKPQEAMPPAGSEPAAEAAPATPATRRSASRAAAKPAFKAPPAPPKKGILNISSKPPVNIIVDGRPLGMTPKSVRVVPGPHTVVFMGPKGRKVRSANVQPGGTQSVGVTF